VRYVRFGSLLDTNGTNIGGQLIAEDEVVGSEMKSSLDLDSSSPASDILHLQQYCHSDMIVVVFVYMMLYTLDRQMRMSMMIYSIVL
jgi:hypothetical protein